MTTTPPDLTAPAVASAVAYADRWLAFRRDHLRVPGVQAAVLHGDALVLSTAHGVADEATGTPLRRDHLFRIASHSKTFTATAVFRLRDAGRLALDDRVGRLLPELAGSPIADRTVQDLLSHAGGVVRDGEDADHWLLTQPFPDEAELLAALGPGSDVLPAQQRFKYSNTAYGVLGLIIARVAGEPYGVHVQREVVDRLGLRRTGPDLDAGRAHECATGHTALSYAERRWPVEQVGTGALASATGFYGTAEDVCTYASAHFDGDPRLLSDEAKRRMRRQEWAVPPDDTASYGLGLAGTQVGDRRLVGHGGGWPGHITTTLFDPVARLAVAVFTNAVDGPAAPLAAGVVRLVDLAAQQTEPDRDDATRARFVGRYANLWGVLDVADLGGRLFALDPGLADPVPTAVALRVEDEQTLRVVDAPGYGAPGETLRFTSGDGRVRSLQGNGGTTYLPMGDHVEALRAAGAVRAPRED